MKIPAGLNIDRVEVSPVSNVDNLLGYEANCFLPNSVAPIGGGFGQTVDLAKTIAVAEAIERFLVFSCTADPNLSENFQITEDYSTNGFAFHPEAQDSARNALCESFERAVRHYVFSKGHKISDYGLSPDLETNSLIVMLHCNFKNTKWYSHSQVIALGSAQNIGLRCLICVSETESGLCIGASAFFENENPLPSIVHSLVEAWRNKRIAELPASNGDSLERRRVRDINNRKVAFAHADASLKFPALTLKLFSTKYFEAADGYLSRARFDVPAWSSSYSDDFA